MKKMVKIVREHLGDEGEDEEGKTGYMTEANGLNADQFIAAHLRDDRFCMYTANDAIQYVLR